MLPSFELCMSCGCIQCCLYNFVLRPELRLQQMQAWKMCLKLKLQLASSEAGTDGADANCSCFMLADKSCPNRTHLLWSVNAPFGIAAVLEHHSPLKNPLSHAWCVATAMLFHVGLSSIRMSSLVHVAGEPLDALDWHSFGAARLPQPMSIAPSWLTCSN